MKIVIFYIHIYIPVSDVVHVVGEIVDDGFSTFSKRLRIHFLLFYDDGRRKNNTNYLSKIT